MKTPITLRSTLNNASWTQRGAAALLAAALIFTLTLALRATTHTPAAAPAVRQAAPAAHNSNVAIGSTGSAYDGRAYWAGQPAAHNSNVSIGSTGSAYDGGQYGALGSVARSADSLPVIGTGSVYDGGRYNVPLAARGATSSLPAIGTGSAFNGGAYVTARPAVRSPNMPVIGTGSAYDGGNYGGN